MYENVKAYIEKYQMLMEGDKVIAGISGGADSLCLLFVLLRLRKELPFGIHAVHINHGIRGAAAEEDEMYVRKICRQEGVPLTVFHENIPLLAKEQHLTEEEAGRKVRRDAFVKVMEEENGTKIALAHHRGDNAETVLWNLCRGTGLAGLGGIAPVSGVWIRPLLGTKREEIESYLEKWEISYCTDITNADNTYTRNRIRNEVIPYLEEHVNRQTMFHISETAEQMRALGDYVRRETYKAVETCLKKSSQEEERWILKAEEYHGIDEALAPYVLHEVLGRVCGQYKDLASVHVRAVSELLKKQVGKELSLPYGMTAVRCYEGISFGKAGGKKKEPRISEENVPEGLYTMRIFEVDTEIKVFPKKTYTKWFDYDIIRNTVKIRHREPGDYLTINRNDETQRLKQYFINEKIPKEERQAIWLVADGSHIMWVVGRRQNQKYQVTEHTRRILEIQFYGGEENGRDGQGNDQ